MPRQRNHTPSYLLHRRSGRARAVWTDLTGTRQQRLLPGEFGSDESKAAFARLQLEVVTSPVCLPATDTARNVSLNEVLLAFLSHAERHYRDPDGNLTTEYREYTRVARHLRELYGPAPAAGFGPLALKAVRQRFVDAGWSRGVVNQRVGRVRRILKWAVAEELVPPAVFHGLAAVAGLQRGRTPARETDPVRPVGDDAVAATLPHLTPHVRVIVELLLHTGMRPAEACGMTLNQIERGAVWVYRPRRHKTAHHGKGRVVPLGPNARAVLAAFLAGRALEPDEPIFSPARCREEQYAAMRGARKSKVQPSQVSRRKADAERTPTDSYAPGAISHAVAAACRRAFPPPAPLAKRRDETAAAWKARLTAGERARLRAWEREHRWHPYQLRHTFATKVRKAHGLEAAQVLLGHARADVTQVYAERNEELAAAVAAKIG
ncbi:catalytic phage domain protein : Integrase, catalytic core, phage domain protein OS=Rhodopirellula sallentina SM41 GN=RSSM_06627 PE=4 SV=1: Phage_integrase [Gemmataceae bacterium]|nr:catalytic phage domain protein : Integrase, catalytic core, phage domain protein OS=Rhodopirellula sallentina SM41 GN=RSSM_06627 PE=4 SV=1: Phage_integrase [Gemmataceae bacterium]VTU00965.1 catalytic phage domain protein : Integrase, catalytic core, phage domain protein OS=Rhodopirellula sallentina SM41 GN=RSSM_06627 PE=4 SV=1: Phage_integrase [Gemmataceae bacterium]